jgi:hypothetical protein
MQFLDTAVPVVLNNKIPHSGLVLVAIAPGFGARFLPFLDDWRVTEQRNLKNFDIWWNSAVFVDQLGRQLTRKDLVLAAANQDGGAHVDPELDLIYSDLSRSNSLGWVADTEPENPMPLPGPEKAALRQIGHEVLKSLDPNYSKMPVYPSDALLAGSSMLLAGEGGPQVAEGSRVDGAFVMRGRFGISGSPKGA